MLGVNAYPGLCSWYLAGSGCELKSQTPGLGPLANSGARQLPALDALPSAHSRELATWLQGPG